MRVATSAKNTELCAIAILEAEDIFFGLEIDVDGALKKINTYLGAKLHCIAQ